MEFNYKHVWVHTQTFKTNFNLVPHWLVSWNEWPVFQIKFAANENTPDTLLMHLSSLLFFKTFHQRTIKTSYFLFLFPPQMTSFYNNIVSFLRSNLCAQCFLCLKLNNTHTPAKEPRVQDQQDHLHLIYEEHVWAHHRPSLRQAAYYPLHWQKT